MLWTALTLFIALLILRLVYQRYSRGLNRFPGPFVASFTDLWKVRYAYNSSQRPAYVDVHRKYGDVVRIGPNELSFSDPRAIGDIYGSKGSSQKVGMFFHSPHKSVLRQELLVYP